MLPFRLLDGYRSFLGDHFATERRRYRRLAEQGQKPQIMVIGCCDSRVAPEIVFDADPGELFVLRNVANLVPPYQPDNEYHGTSAALEFAVQVLKVRHIVVLGHAQCGGVAAWAAEDGSAKAGGPFIGKWMNLIAPAAQNVQEAPNAEHYLRHLELAAIENSLRNLMTFPAIQARTADGSLTLHGAYFGIATGELLVRNPQNGVFAPLDGAHPLEK